MRHLRMEVAEEGRPLRAVVVEALEAYLSSRRENRALMKLAGSTFDEWDNSKDADYDRL